MASYIESFASKLDWAMPFQRTGAFPIDRTTLFESYDDALAYAQGGDDSRSLSGTSYVGQVITVYENDVVTVYKINADKSLEEVGSATNGDNQSIVLSEGLLSLYGFADATEGQQLHVVDKDGTLVLEWYTPDTSTVDGLSSAVGSLQTAVETLNGDSSTAGSVAYQIAQNNENYYTSAEIDGKLTGALHYKGTYATYDELVAAVDDGTITPETGDVYNITEAGGTDASGTEIKAGDNVIYNGTGWDVSAGTMDLSAYYTSDEVDDLLDNKVDKVDGSRLVTEDEIALIEKSVKVEASTTNGNILIDDVETNVYTLPVATTSEIGGILSTASGNNAVTVDSTGKATVDSVDADTIDGVVAEAAKVSNSLSIGSKTYDGSAAVSITASDIPLPDTVIESTDIATEVTTGVVLSSSDQDKVSVDSSTGEMTVNDISASKVVGTVSAASKVTNALTAGDKTYDGSEAVEITADDLGALTATDLTEYVKNTDYANTITGGVIVSTTQGTANAVYVDSTTGKATVDVVSGDSVDGAVATATNATQLGGQDATDILVSGSSQVQSAAEADKLANARTISLSSDATGSGSFDGSANVEIEVTLASVGTAGTYTKVTTDAKGRVTSGTTLSASDIPDLTLDKITDAGALAALDEVSRDNIDSDFESDIADLESASHTHSNKSVLDGIASSDVTHWNYAYEQIDLKADADDVYTKDATYSQTEVDSLIKSAIGGVFVFRGSYETLEALEADVTAGTITPAAGDVYNITTAGGTDMNGTEVKAGDNVVYVESTTSGWDVLAGTMDLSAYATTSALTSGLAEKADKTTVDGIDDRLGEAETDIDNLQSDMTTAQDDIATLNTSVSTNTTNIATNTTNIATNTSAIETLNGDETTEGSVKNLIAASATDINNAITAITEDGGTIDTKIDEHNTDADAHSDLFAAKQNKAIYTSITLAASDFEASSDNGANYKISVTVSDLDSSKDYSPSITPAAESCSAVIAALFYPVAVVDAGVLTLYCVNAPTEDISVYGTFTEIQ